MPRKRATKRASVKPKKAAKKDTKKNDEKNDTREDEEHQDVDPAATEDNTKTSDTPKEASLETGRSRRASATVQKNYTVANSETEEDDSQSSEDEEEYCDKSSKTTPKNKRRNQAARSPAGKRVKTRGAASSRAPLRDIKNKKNGSEELPSPSTPSIKQIRSQMWEENTEDWRSFCAVDY